MLMRIPKKYANSCTQTKQAFTLAEVLITLGIIGVVAAMTIPTLITNYKKHIIETKLPKAIATVNQIVRQSEAENGVMEAWDKTLSPIEYLNSYITPYAKISQICEGEGSCGFEQKHNIWLTLGHRGDNFYNNPFTHGRIPFILMDGVMYVFGTAESSGFKNNNAIVIVDINGSEKPNIFGQDVFFLIRDEEKGAIVPYGAELSESEISKDCNKNGDGLYCAALIRKNSWKVPNNYPIQ